MKAWVILFALLCSSNSAAIEVRDDFDRTVVLDSPARRIISLSPHNTENLYSAGMGSRIIGVDEFSRFPEDAKSIQSVGSAVQVNIEAVIELEPDLIVAWRTASNNERLEKLEELGYTIYYSEPRSFEDIINNIEDFAILGHTTEKIYPAPDVLRQEIEEVEKLYSGRGVLPVFYQVWSNPLMTLNGDHFISRVLELCGAKNIFSDLSLIAPQVSIEAVVQANPDIIITGDSGGNPVDMSIWKGWQSITAVENDNYLIVDSDIMHRHTTRMIMGIRELCVEIDKIRQSKEKQ